jgi:hypothetical protein
VHARLLLVHVPQRDRALAAMTSVLRPGGWLVAEEADPALQPLVCPDETGPAQQLANRLKVGFRQLLAQRGVDLAYGRTLPRRLRAAGLVDVAADAYFPITGAACTELERPLSNRSALGSSPVGSPPTPGRRASRQRGQRRATRPRHLTNDHRMGAQSTGQPDPIANPPADDGGLAVARAPRHPALSAVKRRGPAVALSTVRRAGPRGLTPSAAPGPR